MIRFTEIECVKRNDTLITDIFGTIAQESSDGVPTQVRFRAIDETRGPVWYKEKLIKFLTVNGVKCLFVPDEKRPEKNLLDDFPECQQ